MTVGARTRARTTHLVEMLTTLERAARGWARMVSADLSGSAEPDAVADRLISSGGDAGYSMGAAQSRSSQLISHPFDADRAQGLGVLAKDDLIRGEGLSVLARDGLIRGLSWRTAGRVIELEPWGKHRWRVVAWLRPQAMSRQVDKSA